MTGIKNLEDITDMPILGDVRSQNSNFKIHSNSNNVWMDYSNKNVMGENSYLPSQPLYNDPSLSLPIIYNYTQENSPSHIFSYNSPNSIFHHTSNQKYLGRNHEVQKDNQLHHPGVQLRHNNVVVPCRIISVRPAVVPSKTLSTSIQSKQMVRFDHEPKREDFIGGQLAASYQMNTDANLSAPQHNIQKRSTTLRSQPCSFLSQLTPTTSTEIPSKQQLRFHYRRPSRASQPCSTLSSCQNSTLSFNPSSPLAMMLSCSCSSPREIDTKYLESSIPRQTWTSGEVLQIPRVRKLVESNSFSTIKYPYSLQEELVPIDSRPFVASRAPTLNPSSQPLHTQQSFPSWTSVAHIMPSDDVSCTPRGSVITEAQVSSIGLSKVDAVEPPRQQDIVKMTPRKSIIMKIKRVSLDTTRPFQEGKEPRVIHKTSSQNVSKKYRRKQRKGEVSCTSVNAARVGGPYDVKQKHIEPPTSDRRRGFSTAKHQFEKNSRTFNEKVTRIDQVASGVIPSCGITTSHTANKSFNTVNETGKKNKKKTTNNSRTISTKVRAAVKKRGESTLYGEEIVSSSTIHTIVADIFSPQTMNQNIKPSDHRVLEKRPPKVSTSSTKASKSQTASGVAGILPKTVNTTQNFKIKDSLIQESRACSRIQFPRNINYGSTGDLFPSPGFQSSPSMKKTVIQYDSPDPSFSYQHSKSHSHYQKNKTQKKYQPVSNTNNIRECERRRKKEFFPHLPMYSTHKTNLLGRTTIRKKKRPHHRRGVWLNETLATRLIEGLSVLNKRLHRAEKDKYISTKGRRSSSREFLATYSLSGSENSTSSRNLRSSQSPVSRRRDPRTSSSRPTIPGSISIPPNSVYSAINEIRNLVDSESRSSSARFSRVTKSCQRSPDELQLQFISQLVKLVQKFQNQKGSRSIGHAHSDNEEITLKAAEAPKKFIKTQVSENNSSTDVKIPVIELEYCLRAEPKNKDKTLTTTVPSSNVTRTFLHPNGEYVETPTFGIVSRKRDAPEIPTCVAPQNCEYSFSIKNDKELCKSAIAEKSVGKTFTTNTTDSICNESLYKEALWQKKLHPVKSSESVMRFGNEFDQLVQRHLELNQKNNTVVPQETDQSAYEVRPTIMSLDQIRKNNEQNFPLTQNTHIQSILQTPETLMEYPVTGKRCSTSTMDNIQGHPTLPASISNVSNTISTNSCITTPPTRSTVPSAMFSSIEDPQGRPGICHTHTHSLMIEKVIDSPEKTFTMGTREVEVIRVHENPEVILMPNFLTEEECKLLIEEADGRWEKSKTSRGHASASQDTYTLGAGLTRTSSSSRLPKFGSPLIERIERRVAAAAQYPPEHVESLVVVRYQPGEFFKEHHDGFFRPITILVYLNEVSGGGETEFVELGFKVTPQTGTAVMWYNTTPEGEPDYRLKHAGLQPTKGVKYAVNCFVNCHKQAHILQNQDVEESAPAIIESYDSFSAPDITNTLSNSTIKQQYFASDATKELFAAKSLERKSSLSGLIPLSGRIESTRRPFHLLGPQFPAEWQSTPADEPRNFSRQQSAPTSHEQGSITSLAPTPQENAYVNHQQYGRSRSELDFARFEKLLKLHRLLRQQQKRGSMSTKPENYEKRRLEVVQEVDELEHNNK